MPNFENADLVDVIRFLAEKGHKQVVIRPEVQGRVTWHEDHPVPWDGALALVLKLQEMPFDATFLADQQTVVVAAPAKLDHLEDAIMCPGHKPTPGRRIRQEFILDQTPASLVLPELSRRYPEVKFVPHPTLNGFYAIGNRHAILELKADLGSFEERAPQ